MSGRRQQEFQVGERASVDVELRSGSVDIRTGAPGRATVSLDDGSADDWQLIQLGDSLSIRPAGRRARSVRMLIEVPRLSDVEVRGVSADVTLSGDLGAARLHSVSGTLRIDSVLRLDANSVSGDVRAASVAGDATITTVSGDVEARDIVGRFTGNTSSGDIRSTNVGDDLTIGTTSGDVRIERVGGTAITARSISGDVTIGLPPGIRVEPDISTLSGRTTLPKPASTPPASPPRIVRVRLRTVSGDITIERVDRR